jgi:hypothetical protein
LVGFDEMVIFPLLKKTNLIKIVTVSERTNGIGNADV